MKKLSPESQLTAQKPKLPQPQPYLLTLPSQTKNKELRLSGRFHKIIQDLDKSFSSYKQETNKPTLSQSKVQRKDTRETDPEPFDLILKNQQADLYHKIDPISDLIKKSQIDPFLRRKLKAVVENDLKSLKKLNDQKSKPNPLSSKSYQPNSQSYKVLPASTSNRIDNQISRLPKDIQKILDTSINRLMSKQSMKKIQSEAKILDIFEQDNPSNENSVIEKNTDEIEMTGSYTTLRRQSYMKKISCLQGLRALHEKQVEGCRRK